MPLISCFGCITPISFMVWKCFKREAEKVQLAEISMVLVPQGSTEKDDYIGRRDGDRKWTGFFPPSSRTLTPTKPQAYVRIHPHNFPRPVFVRRLPSVRTSYLFFIISLPEALIIHPSVICWLVADMYFD